MTSAAGSGHPSSCLSCADLVAALFFHEMRWDPRQPLARDVDRFVLSKGHAAPILWAALAEAGALDEDPMSLRQIDSSLEGHPTPANAWVKVATGSLGQGLSAANGMALADRLDGIDARVFACSATANAPKVRSGRRPSLPLCIGWSIWSPSST
jgi:transketolase